MMQRRTQKNAHNHLWFLVVLFAVGVLRESQAQPIVEEWQFDVRLSLDFGSNTVSQNGEVPCVQAPGLWWNDDGRVVAIAQQGTLYSNVGDVLLRHASSIGRQSHVITGDPAQYSTAWWFSTSTGQGLQASRFSHVEETIQDSVEQTVPQANGAIAATRHCDGRDYWVLAGGSSTIMYVHKVTRNGLVPSSVPLTAQAPRINDVMSIGNSGKTVAWTVNQRQIVLATFNNTLGDISNVIVLEPNATVMGLAWSPNGRLLYASAIQDGKAELWQFSTTNPDPSAILASKVVLYSYNGPRVPGMLQTGPDLRMYWVYAGTGYIGTIANPDIPGAGCDVTPQDIAVPIALNGTLPNTIAAFERFFPGCTVPPVADFEMSDTTICVGSCIDLIDHSDFLATSWNWSMPGSNTPTASNQHPKNICYDEVGNFRVTLEASNSRGSSTKSLTVRVVENTFADTHELSYCEGESTALFMGSQAIVRVQPQDGLFRIQADSLVVFGGENRDYSVDIRDTNGCQATISVAVAVLPLPDVRIEPLTGLSVCEGGSIVLEAQGADVVVWTPDDVFTSTTQSIATASVDSSMWLYAWGTNAAGCTSVDSVFVRVTSELGLDLQDELVGCVGEVLPLHIGVADSVFVNGEYTQFDSTGTVPIVIVESTELQVRVWQAGCSGSTTLNVVARPRPVLAISQPSEVCAGEMVEVVAESTSHSVRWYNGSWSANSSQATILATEFPTWVVFEVDNGDCVERDSVILVGKPPQSLEIAASDIVCVGEPVHIVEENGLAVDWYVDGEFVSRGTSATLNELPEGSVMIEARTSEHCVENTRHTVQIAALPVVQVELLHNQEPLLDSLCEGSAFTARVVGAANMDVVIHYNGESVRADSALFVAMMGGDLQVDVVTSEGCAVTSFISVPVRPQWSIEYSIVESQMLQYGDTTILELHSTLDGSIGSVTSAIVTLSIPLHSALLVPVSAHPSIVLDVTANTVSIDLKALHALQSDIEIAALGLVPLLDAQGEIAIEEQLTSEPLCGSVSPNLETMDVQEICLEEVRRVQVVEPVTLMVAQHDDVLQIGLSRQVTFCSVQLTDVLGRILARGRENRTASFEIDVTQMRGPVILTVQTEAGIETKLIMLD